MIGYANATTKKSKRTKLVLFNLLILHAPIISNAKGIIIGLNVAKEYKTSDKLITICKTGSF